MDNLYGSEHVDTALFRGCNPDMSPMLPEKDIEPTSVEDVAERLRLTREAMGWSQAELCRRAGIATQTWNNAETADNRIGVDEAIKLCRVSHVTLDWVYRGSRALLPASVLQRLHGEPTRQRRRRA